MPIRPNATRFRLLAAALGGALVLLAAGAHARTETLEWSHSSPSEAEGFRAHWGTASRSYTSTADLGKPAIASDGTFSASITVPDDATVYVALTAYDGSGTESGYSNERVREPDTSTDDGSTDDGSTDDGSTDDGTNDDSTDDGTSDGSTGETVWSESFDSLSTGTHVSSWVDTAAGNSLVEDDSLFEVVDDGNGNRMLATHSSDTNIHSHYLATGAGDWSTYELRGRMRADASEGIGVTAYSQYDAADAYYRLRAAWSDFELAMHPDGAVSCSDPQTGVALQSGVWYRFRLRVSPASSSTVVRAKVWPEGQSEPSTWQATCTDTRAERPSSGTIGVWSMKSGGKFWDDLEVVSHDGSSGSDDSLSAPGRPTLITP